MLGESNANPVATEEGMHSDEAIERERPMTARTPVEEAYEFGKALLGRGVYTNVHLAKEKTT